LVVLALVVLVLGKVVLALVVLAFVVLVLDKVVLALVALELDKVVLALDMEEELVWCTSTVRLQSLAQKKRLQSQFQANKWLLSVARR